jgi:hypothetical protein
MPYNNLERKKEKYFFTTALRSIAIIPELFVRGSYYWNNVVPNLRS